MANISLPEIDMRILVGKETKAGKRTIWPVTRITVLKSFDDKVQAIQITPIAMLIIEPSGQHAVSSAGKPMTIEAILELAPTLRDILEKMGDAGQD